MIQTEEIDDDGNGAVNFRYVTTTSYDAHGNRVKETFVSAAGPGFARTTIFECTPRGAVLAHVQEHDNRNDGTVDERWILSTLEVDEQGNPTVQVETRSVIPYDPFVTRHVANAYDRRGRLVEYISEWERLTYEYDAHGNVVRHLESDSDSPYAYRYVKSEFTAHDSLWRSEVTYSNEYGTSTFTVLTTVDHDAHGYPTRQVGETTGTSVRHFTRDIIYDDHHNVVRITEEEDSRGDSSVDWRRVVQFEYSDPGLVPDAAIRAVQGSLRSAASPKVLADFPAGRKDPLPDVRPDHDQPVRTP